MSLVEAQHIPESRLRAERMYRRAETKAMVLTDLWQTASFLVPPLLSDSPDVITDENNDLYSVLDRALVTMPEAFQGYKDYLHVQDSSGTPEGNGTKRAEQERIRRSTEDFDFARIVRNGVDRIIERRGHLRDVQSQVGEPDLGYYYKDPSGFAHLSGVSAGLEGSITRANLGPLSFTLFLEPGAYDVRFSERHKTRGVHMRGFTVNSNMPIELFSYIKDDLHKFINNGTLSPRELSREQREVMAHEGFHAFSDVFRERDNNFFIVESNILNSIDTIRNNSESITDEQMKIILGSIERSLRMLPNSSSEEILAELASLETREGIPYATFATLAPMKEELVSFAKAEVGAEEYDPSRNVNLVDVGKLQERIAEIYKKVDKEIPDCRMYVDALFALYPPSNIRSIERVVERWLAQRRRHPR